MSNNDNFFHAFFNQILEPLDFRNQKNNWYHETPEAVQIINLQKSAYSNNYYVNLAIWLKCFGNTKNPKENKCHVRCRLSTIAGTALKKPLENALNWENQTLNQDQRRKILTEAIKDCAIPFLKKASTLLGIKAIYQDELASQPILADLKQLLNTLD